MSNAMRKEALDLPVSNQTTAADFILDYLSQVNVDKIFGVPGGAIEPLFDAIARFNRNSNSSMNMKNSYEAPLLMDLIVSRHEVGAAFMADGYARESGRMAVCCATTGPGSTNLITGVASAYMDQIPMLVLTPQTSMANFGRYDLQDSSDDAISITSMFSKCTRYSSVVTHIDQLKHKLKKAVKIANTHPRGPVHLSIPMEIWNHAMDGGEMVNNGHFVPGQHEGYEHNGYGELCRLATNDKKVLFLLGPGSLPYAQTIVECAELLNAEIITTPAAKGAVQANHCLYRGVLGFAGHTQAIEALLDEGLDHIITIGTNLNPFETAGLCSNSAVIEKMIYINYFGSDSLVSDESALQLYGSLNKIFHDFKKHLLARPAMNTAAKNKPLQQCYRVPQYAGVTKICCERNILASTRVDQLEKSLVVKPQYLMSKLPELLPSTARYHVDAGNSWAWATHYLHLNTTSNYKIAMGFGSMGWAVGASVGAACAQKEAPVVCITGDGSYLMSGQEITVAVQQQLSVIFVVLNDSAYGMVKHGQRIGGAEEIGFELPTVDFALMAQAVGARGVTIRNAQELDELDITSLLSERGPVLLDVHIDAEEVPPMASRLKELNRG
ncbi:MAG: thiamine pyrophosphate-binding protein [Thiotrichaceae bacterium]|nr:thiamine pyrophosphate-binding protein [Thiotrichaceae bacterium]